MFLEPTLTSFLGKKENSGRGQSTGSEDLSEDRMGVKTLVILLATLLKIFTGPFFPAFRTPKAYIQFSD